MIANDCHIFVYVKAKSWFTVVKESHEEVGDLVLCMRFCDLTCGATYTSETILSFVLYFFMESGERNYMVNVSDKQRAHSTPDVRGCGIRLRWHMHIVL